MTDCDHSLDPDGAPQLYAVQLKCGCLKQVIARVREDLGPELYCVEHATQLTVAYRRLV